MPFLRELVRSIKPALYETWAIGEIMDLEDENLRRSENSNNRAVKEKAREILKKLAFLTRKSYGKPHAAFAPDDYMKILSALEEGRSLTREQEGIREGYREYFKAIDLPFYSSDFSIEMVKPGLVNVDGIINGVTKIDSIFPRIAVHLTYAEIGGSRLQQGEDFPITDRRYPSSITINFNERPPFGKKRDHSEQKATIFPHRFKFI